LRSIPLTYAEINSKWTINLNVKSKTTKLLEKKLKRNYDLGQGFLDLTPKVKFIKKKK